MRILTYCTFGGGFYKFSKTGSAELIDARPPPIHWDGLVSTGQVGDEVCPEVGDKIDLTTVGVQQAEAMDKTLAEFGLKRRGAAILEMT